MHSKVLIGSLTVVALAIVGCGGQLQFVVDSGVVVGSGALSCTPRRTESRLPCEAHWQRRAAPGRSERDR